MSDISNRDTPLNTVQLEGLVVLQILKHCRESLPDLVTGQLLGLDVEDRLEVTSCFPFPSRTSPDDDDDQEGAEYQIEMMHRLREVNVDNNTVGWYQSTYLGSFLNDAMIETQYNYQDNIEKSVVIVYDPLRSSQGTLSLRAFRLTKTFMAAYNPACPMTPEMIREYELTHEDVFEELPIIIHNGALVRAMLYELDAHHKPDTSARLDLSIQPYIEKNLEFLCECADDLGTEQSKLQYHLRNVARQHAQQQQFWKSRQQDNIRRQAEGLEPLSMSEDAVADNPIFKPIPSPSRLESLLVTNQIANYCAQVNQFSNVAFSKLYLLEGLQKHKAFQ